MFLPNYHFERVNGIYFNIWSKLCSVLQLKTLCTTLSPGRQLWVAYETLRQMQPRIPPFFLGSN